MAASFLHCPTSSTTKLYSNALSKPKFPHSSSSSYSYKPIKAGMFEHSASWATVNTDVEKNIKTILADREPATIFEPMSHLVGEVPRSMAPALCVAACEVVGGDREKAIAAACALHLMHTATYTHEYLQLSNPAMGLARPMGHHGYGPVVELLAGDGMIPIGYELLAAMESQPNSNSQHIVQVMGEVAFAMGAQGMVHGQYLKMKCMGLVGDVPVDDATIYEALEKKGGALYSCGAACGAILGGGSEEEIEKLRRFGLYVGMIHNIMVRDVLGKDKKLMKFAASLRFLALKELEGMREKNVEKIASIIDGFSIFLRVQKFKFPTRA
ncbi:hypothetical protein ACHQM5_004013 [Ranunculus cassubicifolius]